MKIYNPNIPKKIVDEIYRLNEQYFQFDKPIPFKEGLTLYPVNLRYHDIIHNGVANTQTPKNNHLKKEVNK